jgi:hypothetical protein
VGSKKKRNETLTFKIISDQKSEKLRIKPSCVLLVKVNTRQPNKGKQIRDNNIKKENNFVQRDSNSYQHIRSMLFYPLNYERKVRNKYFITELQLL